jgi:glutamate dehydrogenase
MKPDSSSAVEALAAHLPERFAAVLTASALPGETDGLSGEKLASAAAFVARTAATRIPGTPALAIESLATTGGPRRMRLAIMNDDMPFLVDSISAAIGAQGLAIHRLLHPVVAVNRAADGQLEDLPPDSLAHESVIYLEVDRADARVRRVLADELLAVLRDVSAAVADWPKMQIAMRTEAAALPIGEGAELVHWFVDRHFTMLGHRVERSDGGVAEALGLFRVRDPQLWDDAARAAAIGYFQGGGAAPLILKADRLATVHRRVPIDMIVLPVREGSTVTGVSVHAGLWTSAALRAPSDEIPVLRGRLAAIERTYGFDPGGHAGKALHHALSALPHDVLIALDAKTLESTALTAMSLANRPRPKLLLLPSPLRRHLFAFVWLPREELSTARRVGIGSLLAQAAGGTIAAWSIDLDVGELALVRFTIDVPADGATPDTAALDRQIEQMVRGWSPAIEAALGVEGSPGRATRLALTYADAFPVAYRNRYTPQEAATDIQRLQALEGPDARGARLFRAAGEAPGHLSLKIYRAGGLIPLSEAVPVLENFGFRVLEEIPTALDGGIGTVHDFRLEVGAEIDVDALFARAEMAERAIAAVLEGRAESDAFNQLILAAALPPRAVLLFRAWFRYLRQTGLSYGLDTVAGVLRRAPDVARALIALFDARHDPAARGDADGEAASAAIDAALLQVAAIDDDRILRRLRAVISAVLRTNAFTSAGSEALAFKLDSAGIPGLPAPVPWREIWIYSPRVEGIHLRGGPVARGGIRWSDRRDDFRTEILGLMKAQVVKNAVIVPTGAKGGFFAKHLPSPGDRDAWLAEGTESYRIFIRALLSVTDNIVADAVVHPDGVTVRDGEDPYFVVAADKGTAAFSDVANGIAEDRGFWLGDAFASGGSQGYDHKAMGITARGAWISVQRHFAEMGVDVQADPIRVVGCGDMSGDVFGNGMLLSKTIRLVAAFDHRHIFLDPNPDAEASWAERDRMFRLPRSSWTDYDAGLISPGGGVFPRTQKQIPLSPEIRAALGIDADTIDPSGLIVAILKAPVDLLWFGGIGTYLKGADETNAEVGDPANDAHRINGGEVRARAIGEGANLGVTQAGRIEYAAAGGRIDTDFIDNSAGVDCSDNEVNIKIALNREMAEGRLPFADRNALLVRMTDEVAELVLDDNRLQTLALSLAERGGVAALPAQVRAIEILETGGRLNRDVEGLEASEPLLRRAQDGRGLTRPELSVLLSHAKLALQAAIEASDIAEDPGFIPLLHAAFPHEMQDRFANAIDRHRLRPQIIATKAANRVVNRLGPIAPLEIAEEEGVALAQVAAGYFAVDGIFGLEALFEAAQALNVADDARLVLMEMLATGAQQIGDVQPRASPEGVAPAAAIAAIALQPRDCCAMRRGVNPKHFARGSTCRASIWHWRTGPSASSISMAPSAPPRWRTSLVRTRSSSPPPMSGWARCWGSTGRRRRRCGSSPPIRGSGCSPPGWRAISSSCGSIFWRGRVVAIRSRRWIRGWPPRGREWISSARSSHALGPPPRRHRRCSLRSQATRGPCWGADQSAKVASSPPSGAADCGTRR